MLSIAAQRAWRDAFAPCEVFERMKLAFCPLLAPKFTLRAFKPCPQTGRLFSEPLRIFSSCVRGRCRSGLSGFFRDLTYNRNRACNPAQALKILVRLGSLRFQSPVCVRLVGRTRIDRRREQDQNK